MTSPTPSADAPTFGHPAAKTIVAAGATVLIAIAQAAMAAGLIPAVYAGWISVVIAALGSAGVFAVPNSAGPTRSQSAPIIGRHEIT